MAVKIIGTGSYLPVNVVSNSDLAQLVDTSDEWICSRTGIRNRRIATKETTTELATRAALDAIHNAEINPLEIDLIIVATMSGDYYLPSTACEVQSNVNAKNAVCFDLNAACTGFVFALNTVEAYMKSGMSKTALVIGAETLSKMINWEDRSTCVLFGDGAGAVVVRANKEQSTYTNMGSDGSKKEMLTCKNRETSNFLEIKPQSIDYIHMNGGEVFKFAVKTVAESILEILEQSGINIDDIKYFFLHQANKRIIQSISKKLGISEEKFPINLDQYGNTSAASIPILLDEINKQGKLNPGDKIVLSGFGGGLTWGNCIVTW